MGENVLESQAKNTQKRRARHAANQQQGHLFGRGEHVMDDFTVDRTPGLAAVKIGDTLHCFPGKTDAPVDLVHENQLVGIVKGDGGDVLRKIVQETGCRAAIVRSVCEMTDTLKVQIQTD